MKKAFYTFFNLCIAAVVWLIINFIKGISTFYEENLNTHKDAYVEWNIYTYN